MGLLDGFVPQGFADRGGMLGRLLSLRPDLAQGSEGSDQAAHSPLWLTSATWPGTSGNVAGSPAAGRGHPVQLAEAGPPIRIYSPDPAYVQPQLEPVSSYPPYTASDPPLPAGFAGAGPLLGIGLAAALAGRKSSELVAGRHQPMAPVFPEPPVAPVPPQTPSMPPLVAPVAPQTPSMPPQASPVAPQFGPPPQQPTPRADPTQAPTSSDDFQQARVPEWRQLQSFFDNTRDNSSDGGGGEPEIDCNEERRKANKYCEEKSRDYNRNMLGPFKSKTPWTWDDCLKGFMDKRCGGNDSSRPENYYWGNWKDRRKPGRGGRRKKK